MARHGKKNFVPGTKTIRETERVDTSPNSGTTISITTIGKRPIRLLKESKGY